LLALVSADAHFRNSSASGAKQLKPGLLPLVQLSRGKFALLPASHAQLRRGGLVDEQETALLVLDRNTHREEPENILQKAGFALESGLGFGLCGRGDLIGRRALHNRGGCQSLL
jgi:hypothetical protein